MCLQSRHFCDYSPLKVGQKIALWAGFSLFPLKFDKAATKLKFKEFATDSDNEKIDYQDAQILALSNP